MAQAVRSSSERARARQAWPRRQSQTPPQSGIAIPVCNHRVDKAFSCHVFRMCSHCWWDRMSWVDQAKIKFKGTYSMASAKIFWTNIFSKISKKCGDFICLIITIPWSTLSIIYLRVTKILRLFSLF